MMFKASAEGEAETKKQLKEMKDLKRASISSKKGGKNSLK